jgi:cation diffusion facilitator CzcD-associated flavoprotein CzcO
MKVKSVGVIGAGVSGLVTAKTFLAESYEVTVFEKQKSVGGVWEKSRTYPGLTLQSPRDTYCFYDYPMPESYPDTLTAEQVRNYINSYARHFGLLEKIKFKTEVIDVQKSKDNPGWLVTVKEQQTNSNEQQIKTYEFDFVIVCNGVHSLPKIPSFPGMEEFTASGGYVLHSTQCNDTSIIEGKRVIVLGCSKSACDIANLAAKLAQESTLVFNEPKWMVPRYSFGFINIKYWLLTRFTESWLPYRHMSKWERVLHTFGKPLVWLFWRTIELILRLQLRLGNEELIPTKPINQMSSSSFIINPEGFIKYIRSGKIKTRKTTITRFIRGGVELANGEQLQADVVVFGTGFHRRLPFLETRYSQLITDEEGNSLLYRHLIHPDIPQMGFVGYNSTYFNLISSEVSAWWLVEYVKGNLQLPTAEEMYQEVATELNNMKANFGYVPDQGMYLFPFSLRYIDRLLKDISGDEQLVIWENIGQIMLPVGRDVYKKVIEKIKLRKLNNVPTHVLTLEKVNAN